MSKPKPESKSKLEGASAEVETQDQAWQCRGPSLMVHHVESQLITLYDASHQMHQTKASREFADKSICGSQGDWILACDFENMSECCILNEVTMEKLQVPTLGEYELNLFDNFLLSASPDAGANCTVFVINSTEIFYYKIGASEFSKQDLGSSFSPLDRAITIFQGRMYYIDDICYKLKCAQLKDSLPLQFEKCIDGYKLEDQLLFERSCYHYLFESDDCLVYVHGRSLEMGVMDFQVFRADLSRKVWEQIHCIGSDRAIFIDEFRGFSANVPPGGLLKGNCIYYTSQLDDDDMDCNMNLFSFDLEDGFVTTLPMLPFKIRRENPETSPRTIWINCSSRD